MATMHMDTDIAHETQSTLISKHQEMLASLQQSTSSVSNLSSHWQGNSASQFIQEYTQWSSAMNQMLEEFSKMGTRLLAEISEWEQTAATFE